jgi:hypothetical protein
MLPFLSLLLAPHFPFLPLTSNDKNKNFPMLNKWKTVEHIRWPRKAIEKAHMTNFSGFIGRKFSNFTGAFIKRFELFVSSASENPLIVYFTPNFLFGWFRFECAQAQ